MTETAPRGVPLPGILQLHAGRKVPATGIYSLKKGEVVVPESKTLEEIVQREADARKTLGKGKSKFEKAHKMILDHNDDDSFAITHQFKSKDEGAATPKEKRFSARNARALVKHVKQVYGAQ